MFKMWIKKCIVLIAMCNSIICIQVHENVSEAAIPENHRPDDIANNMTEVDAKALEFVDAGNNTQSSITLKNAKLAVETQKMENGFKARVVNSNTVEAQPLQRLNSEEVTKIQHDTMTMKQQQLMNNLNNLKQNLNPKLFKNQIDSNKASLDQKTAKTAEVKNTLVHGNQGRHTNFVASPELGQPFSRETTPNNYFHPTNEYYPSVTPSATVATKWLVSNQDSYIEPKKTPWSNDIHIESDNNWNIPPIWLNRKELDKANQEFAQNPKGSWKWIPETNKADYPDPTDHTPSYETYYEHKDHHQFQSDYPRPTVSDHPYTFEDQHTSQYPGPDSYGTTINTTNIPGGPFNPLSTISLFRHGHFDSDYKNPPQSLKSGKQPISTWHKVFSVLGAAIPIGLIISALTPRVIFVNPNTTAPSLQLPAQNLGYVQQSYGQSSFPGQNNFPFRQRSSEETNRDFLKNNPLMKILNTLDGGSQETDTNQSCENRIFCELAVLGASKSNTEMLYRMLWNVANDTPEQKAEKAGLKGLFGAIKAQNCDVFECKHK